jgi:hypothetical protein
MALKLRRPAISPSGLLENQFDNVERKITFLHPGFEDEDDANVLIRLPAWDSSEGVFG